MLRDLAPAQPVTVHWPAERRISSQLAHHYVEVSWLDRLGHGYFMRPRDQLDLGWTLAALPGGFHLGGKAALAWHGYQHNRAARPVVELYAVKPLRLPRWLSDRFFVSVRRRHLFNDPNLCVAPWRDQTSLKVSEPERAVLEMLWGVPQHQSLEEATRPVESLYGLRPGLLQPLLESSHGVKAVRLFLRLAAQASLPVLGTLKLDRVNRGSATPYVRKHESTTLRL